MILDKKWKFFCLFLDIKGLEILFDDHQVKTQALLDYKNMDFTQMSYWLFKVVNHDFGQKLDIISLFFDKMGLEIMVDDHWDRKQAHLDYKNLDITKLPYWDSFKGGTLRFCSKINFLFVCFLAKYASQLVNQSAH